VGKNVYSTKLNESKRMKMKANLEKNQE